MQAATAGPHYGLLGLQAMKSSLHSCMQQRGQGLVQGMLLGLIQSCPRSLLRALSAPLLALLTDPALAENVKSVAQQVIGSQQYAGRLTLSACA